MLEFNSEQIIKLSDLFMDIAKGMFLSVLAVPVLSPSATFFESLRSFLTALLFVYFSLKILERKTNI